jgi:predicted flap endonuclease-1-like 5' DNA nuclease
MDLLYSLIYSSTQSTHHKFALDALSRLSVPQAEEWRRLFLYHHDDYLRGAKDPDTRFRDFKNHVLHVHENCWGGAIEASVKWYRIALQALQDEDWSHAVYASGVLSHYVTDPVMPFHSAQNDQENNIHRACEWSIFHAYDSLFQARKMRKGFPRIELAKEETWLMQAVVTGAEYGSQFYDDLVEHYNFDQAVKRPASGLDSRCREMVGTLLVYTVEHWATILNQLICDSQVLPPQMNMAYPAAVAVLRAPARYLVGNFAASQDRELILKIHREWKQTGKVEATQPLDERTIDTLYRKEVLSGRWAEICALREKTGSSRIRRPLPAPSAPPTDNSSIEETDKETRNSSTQMNHEVNRKVKSKRISIQDHAARLGGVVRKIKGVRRTLGGQRGAGDSKRVERSKAKLNSDQGHETQERPEVSKSSQVLSADHSEPKSGGVKSGKSAQKIWRKDPPQIRFSGLSGESSTRPAPNEVGGADEMEWVQPRVPEPEEIGDVLVEEHHDGELPQLLPESESMLETALDSALEQTTVERALDLSDRVQAELDQELAEDMEPAPGYETEAEYETEADTDDGESAYYLLPEDGVHEAPGIGGKSAKRLGAVGIRTVSDLLAADACEVAEAVSAKYVDADLVRDWQDQSRLTCEVPDLEGYVAQLLVACDYRQLSDLALCDPYDLFHELDRFSRTGEGRNLMGNAEPLDPNLVAQWVENAKTAQGRKAA